MIIKKPINRVTDVININKFELCKPLYLKVESSLLFLRLEKNQITAKSIQKGKISYIKFGIFNTINR